MRVGKLTNISIGTNVSQKELEIDWKITKFSSLPRDSGYRFSSPLFNFADAFWYLELVFYGPQMVHNYPSSGYIGLYLNVKGSGPTFNMEYTLGLKTFNGKRDSEYHRQHTFSIVNEGYGVHACITTFELYERKSDLMLDDDLTLFCNLKYPENNEDTISEKLLNDLKKMMLNGEHSDTIIKVKEKDFQVHKNILSVRNPFFHEMFKNDMKEKTMDIISIDYCEPDIFRSFIHFVYTGKVDQLSLENVCDLYEVADKYQEDQLKRECLHFMINMMSIESLCDFIVLALKHDEKKLLQKATEFFCSKLKKIIRSAKWQTFMAEYPVQANDLYIEALENSDKKIPIKRLKSSKKNPAC